MMRILSAFVLVVVVWMGVSLNGVSKENRKLRLESGEIIATAAFADEMNMTLFHDNIRLRKQNAELLAQVKWLDGRRTASR